MSNKKISEDDNEMTIPNFRCSNRTRTSYNSKYQITQYYARTEETRFYHRAVIT